MYGEISGANWAGKCTLTLHRSVVSPLKLKEQNKSIGLRTSRVWNDLNAPTWRCGSFEPHEVLDLATSAPCLCKTSKYTYTWKKDGSSINLAEDMMIWIGRHINPQVSKFRRTLQMSFIKDMYKTCWHSCSTIFDWHLWLLWTLIPIHLMSRTKDKCLVSWTIFF